MEHIAQKNTQIASKYFNFDIKLNSFFLIYESLFIKKLSHFKTLIYFIPFKIS